MQKDSQQYQCYVDILKEELVPAMGCTEPIALAYAAAKARTVLGALPDRVVLQVSGSIIKNVKSVIVPNTGHLKGISAAAAAGIVAGVADKELEVISQVSASEQEAIKEYLNRVQIEIQHIDWGHVFDLQVTAFQGSSWAKVRITDFHTNIVLIEKDGQVLLEKPVSEAEVYESRTDRSMLNVADIWDFATTADLRDVEEILERQIRCNNAIAEEGLLGDYGANIGSTLLATYGNDVTVRAKAKAAAGSDARMNGCELPVIINSGSGNQGITVSVPIIEYAKALACPKERLYRALVLSNLIAIHEKTGIGRLSAYCGAVSAGCAAGCAIAYLQGADLKAVSHTLVNALAIVSGIICDGAKPSCAAKIASSVEAGILGYHMYQNGQQFRGGDGIVSKGVENTIRNIGMLGHDGMRETDKEIVKIMMQKP